jgi:hypothetical protein
LDLRSMLRRKGQLRLVVGIGVTIMMLTTWHWWVHHYAWRLNVHVDAWGPGPWRCSGHCFRPCWSWLLWLGRPACVETTFWSWSIEWLYIWHNVQLHFIAGSRSCGLYWIC